MGFLKNVLRSIGGNAGGLLATGVNVAGQIYTNQQNLKFQEEMNRMNWQRQREFIDDERAYNDPKAQMQRLEAAGINTTFAGMNTNVDAGSQVGGQTPLQGVAPQMANPFENLSTDLMQTSQSHLNTAEKERYAAMTPQLVNKAEAEISKIYADKHNTEVLTQIHEHEEAIAVMNRAIKASLFEHLLASRIHPDELVSGDVFDSLYPDGFKIRNRDHGNYSQLYRLAMDLHDGKLSKEEYASFCAVADGVVESLQGVVNADVLSNEASLKAAIKAWYDKQTELMPDDNRYKPNSEATYIMLCLSMIARYGFKDGLNEMVNFMLKSEGSLKPLSQSSSQLVNGD